MGTILTLLGMGVVVLYSAFSLLAGIAPDDAALASAIAAAIAVGLLARYAWLDAELRDRGGDPFLRDRRNRQRERRGF